MRPQADNERLTPDERSRAVAAILAAGLAGLEPAGEARRELT
jgi:hypothetical protein